MRFTQVIAGLAIASSAVASKTGGLDACLDAIVKFNTDPLSVCAKANICVYDKECVLCANIVAALNKGCKSLKDNCTISSKSSSKATTTTTSTKTTTSSKATTTTTTSSKPTTTTTSTKTTTTTSSKPTTTTTSTKTTTTTSSKPTTTTTSTKTTSSSLTTTTTSSKITTTTSSTTTSTVTSSPTAACTSHAVQPVKDPGFDQSPSSNSSVWSGSFELLSEIDTALFANLTALSGANAAVLKPALNAVAYVAENVSLLVDADYTLGFSYNRPKLLSLPDLTEPCELDVYFGVQLLLSLSTSIATSGYIDISKLFQPLAAAGQIVATADAEAVVNAALSLQLKCPGITSQLPIVLDSITLTAQICLTAEVEAAFSAIDLGLLN